MGLLKVVTGEFQSLVGILMLTADIPKNYNCTYKCSHILGKCVLPTVYQWIQLLEIMIAPKSG